LGDNNTGKKRIRKTSRRHCKRRASTACENTSSSNLAGRGGIRDLPRRKRRKKAGKRQKGGGIRCARSPERGGKFRMGKFRKGGSREDLETGTRPVASGLSERSAILAEGIKEVLKNMLCGVLGEIVDWVLASGKFAGKWAGKPGKRRNKVKLKTGCKGKEGDGRGMVGYARHGGGRRLFRCCARIWGERGDTQKCLEAG